MGKRMKSYLVFTGLGYRIVVFAVVPVLLILFGSLSSVIFDFPGYLLAVSLLPAIEIAMDAFIFEGVASKKIAHLEYLKTSKHGSELMKQSLQGGILRMLFSSAVILIINYLVYHGRTADIWNGKMLFQLLWFYVLAYIVSMGMIVIARFFMNAQINYTLGFLSFLVEILIMKFLKNMYISFAILVVLGVVISIFSVKIVEKRIKESYYDKTA